MTTALDLRCDSCDHEPTQGVEPCASCNAAVCALCRVLRFPADPESCVGRIYCTSCDPKAPR